MSNQNNIQPSEEAEKQAANLILDWYEKMNLPRIEREGKERRAMLRRIRSEKGKHHHVWGPVATITPITKPLRLGKKHSTKMWDCLLCGATKYRGRTTEIIGGDLKES